MVVSVFGFFLEGVGWLVVFVVVVCVFFVFFVVVFFWGGGLQEPRPDPR